VLLAEAARIGGDRHEEPDWRFRGDGHVMFGPVAVRPSQVFLRGRLSRAFVNIKPVLPGHVLVAPSRCTPRLAELGADELADLFETARAAGRVVERAQNAESLQFSVQDGAASGQSVPHVHVHVLPRRAGDLAAGDDVYAMLEASASCVSQAVKAGSAGDHEALDMAWGGLRRLGTAAGDGSTRLDPSAGAVGAGSEAGTDPGDTPAASSAAAAPSLRDASCMATEAEWYVRVGREVSAEGDPRRPP